MPNVIDLDILRPEAKIIKIGGKEIDVSFVPCGITFDLDPIVQQLLSIKAADIKKDPAKAKEAFMLGVRLCALFCARKYPEFDEKWLLDNINTEQLTAFTKAIQEALFASYAGVAAHAKN